MKERNIILMADIIDSQSQAQPATQDQFRHLVNEINSSYKNLVLSPLTITLGDEFQGVIKSTKAAVEIVIAIEEYLLFKNSNINLRYVIVEGIIDTPINKEVAYGMVGEGLTIARKVLNISKKRKKRFSVSVIKRNDILKDFFKLYEMFIAMWGRTEGTLIEHLLKESDYKIVAAKLGKTNSLIWKRKRSLHIEEYNALKNILNNAI